MRGSGRFEPASATGPGSCARRFNPLHCGAVVASERSRLAVRGFVQVTIPYIAGQWSLPAADGGVAVVAVTVSIPFIAGQWSLLGILYVTRGAIPLCFNPLHCGAVVASRRYLVSFCHNLSVFQSPSLRGSGRFLLKSMGVGVTVYCFNPLHCGAVVASSRWA